MGLNLLYRAALTYIILEKKKKKWKISHKNLTNPNLGQHGTHTLPTQEKNPSVRSLYVILLKQI